MSESTVVASCEPSLWAPRRPKKVASTPKRISIDATAPSRASTRYSTLRGRGM
jgi:hypothetical protein